MDRREFLALAASAPFVLAGAASAMREALGGGTPAVLVTADTEAHVAVVSVRSGRVLRRVPTLEGPRSIEAAAGRLAVVAHTGEGAVSLLDAGTLRVRRVLRGFAAPRYTAADPFGRYAYVTDSGHGEVAAIDLERGRVVRRTAVGGPARHVSLDPASGRLWTALGSQAPRLALLDVRDPAGPRLAGRLEPPFLAHDVVFAPGGARVWVSSGDRGRIAVYDPRARRPLRLLAGDAPPQHLAFAGGRVFVTSGDDASLRVQRAADGGRYRRTEVPAGSYNVTAGFGLVATPSLERGTLVLLSPGGAVELERRIAPSSHDACFVTTA